MTWQPKPSLTVETSHWTSSNMDYVPLHSSFRLWDLDFQMISKFTLIWKEDFGPLSNSPVLFLLSPGKWLGSPFPEDVWAWRLLMHWLQLQFTLPSSPKCLNLLCLTVFSSLWSSLLLVHIFLPNFFLPVNFAFNMLWYSTPWTATPFSNDPLLLSFFVEGINNRLLDNCQVSSVPH